VEKWYKLTTFINTVKHLQSHSDKRCYISSRITGLDLNTAYQNFEQAERVVREMDYIVVNPMTLHPDNLTWLGYMVRDLYQLAFCRNIYMFGEWRRSKGARIELMFAKLKKMNIIYEKNTVAKWK